MGSDAVSEAISCSIDVIVEFHWYLDPSRRRRRRRMSWLSAPQIDLLTDSGTTIDDMEVEAGAATGASPSPSI